jgi:outer membrane protein assembly factor BamB
VPALAPNTALRACVAGCLLAVVVCGEARLTAAEIVLGSVNYDISTGREKPQASFTLPTQAADFKDSLEEFQRLVQHQAWEKAFKSLETIASKTTSGFVDRGDGVLMPSRMLLRSLLAGLPSAGKNAYRVFFDAQAAALWDKAAGAKEADNLSAIVNNHLISSVGDRAADRLGDLYFEQGEMEQAVAAWRSVLSYCPDSKLPAAQILVKIATVLAREGRWTEFGDVERTVSEKFPNETVEVGGRRLKAADEIARLGQAQHDKVPASSAPLPDDLALPESDEPAWQFQFQTKPEPGNQNNPFQLMDIYGRMRVNDFPIPAAIDGQRVYVNLFGIEMAFELATGKLVWRTGRLHQLQLQQGRQGVMPERYRIMVVGDRTWSVTRDPQQVNQHPPLFSLVTREAATGKEVWSSRRSLSGWNVMGTPRLAGDQIYVGAGRTNQGRELAVLVLSAKDGKLLKTLTLGNHAVDQNQVYNERIAEPSFFVHRDRLFVDTHAGALVSVQPGTGTIDWGILYESPPSQTGYYYSEYQPPQLGVGETVYAAGLLFSKGMRSTRLLGVQPDGPGVVWNRPVSRSAIIAGADEEYVYLGGEELTAYNLKTQDLVWATQVPRTASWSEPLVTKNRLYQFTSRGICEIDKHSGRLLRMFRGVDLDSFGGALFVTPNALVTVSNLGITAYPRGSAESAASSRPAGGQP